jgi:integrase
LTDTFRKPEQALETVGLSGIHIHGLRHTGNQLTADAGANLPELMAKMGHDSPRAALIYLHSSAERQRTLADAVGHAARAELAKPSKHKTARSSGTRKARGLNDCSKN